MQLGASKMNSKKGQGAAEYLILLAVVLIVAIVAIALLGGFTDVGASATENEGRQYWTGSVRPFLAPEYSQQNSTFYVTLKNVEPARIILTSISLDGTDSYISNVSFNGGATKTISFPVSTTCDEVSYDFFEYDVVINYTTSNDVTKSQIGAKPFAGRCISG